jgi:hypothetical protein
VRSYHFALVFFNISFVVFFNFVSMNLSWSHDISHGFCMSF